MEQPTLYAIISKFEADLVPRFNELENELVSICTHLGVDPTISDSDKIKDPLPDNLTRKLQVSGGKLDGTSAKMFENIMRLKNHLGMHDENRPMEAVTAKQY